MHRKNLIQKLATKILSINKPNPIKVAIDGIDASGKTYLANELTKYLQNSKRQIINSSIDGFHNPKKIRYKKGRSSPNGYYKDSFNYQSVIKNLLLPLSAKGNLRYCVATFDYQINQEIKTSLKIAKQNAILIMDGVFLLRPELINYWDLKIFLNVDFKTTLLRAIQREKDQKTLGNKQDIINWYKIRYIPGQKLYFAESNPQKKANIIIDNNNFNYPKINKF